MGLTRATKFGPAGLKHVVRDPTSGMSMYFFFFDKKHEIFIQLEKSYSRESIQTLR